MLALLCTMLGTAWGGSITFADLGLENGVQYSNPFDGGDFTVTFVGGTNDGKYYNTGQAIRVYGNGQMVVEAKSGNLTQILVTFANGNDYRPTSADVVDTGTFDPESGIWTGTATKVTFTRPAGSGHWRIQKVEATVIGATPLPTISGTTPFTFETTVTITPSNPDFAVYYTINGSTPCINSDTKTYKGPFVLDATTTVKAVEEDLAGNLSPVVEKTFVKIENQQFPVAADIAAFNAMEDGTEATLTLNNAQVLFVGTNDIYIRDASAAIDFYRTGLIFNPGQVLNGQVTGKSTRYYDTPEMAKTDNTNADNITATSGTATAKVVTIAQAKSPSYYCDLIKVQGVQLAEKQEGNYTNVYAYIGSDSIQVYDKFKVGFGEWNTTDTYEVEGILLPYNGKYEIAITKPVGTGGDDPGLPVAASIAAFKALEDGTEATLTLNNAQVLFVGTNDVYVRDGSGAIDFYKTGINFVAGQVMNGKISGKSTKYNDLPELVKTDNTNDSGYTSSAGSTVARLLTIAEAKSEIHYCDLIKIENVNVVDKVEGSYTNYYAYIGNDSILIYDRFQVGMGEWNTTDTYDVEGILVPFKGKYEIYLTKSLVPGGDTPGLPTVADIAAFKALDANTEATLTLNNAQVVYANGRDVFVRDGSGAIDFYNTGIEFETNQMLNGKITGKLSFYQNLPELAKTDNTNADNINFFTDSEAKPWNISIAEANGDKYLCDLIQLDEIKLKLEDGNTYAYDFNNNSIQIYDKWKFMEQQVSPEDYDNSIFWLKGILVIYKTSYQVYPILVNQDVGIMSLTTDDDDNAPVYNLAGQRVDNGYKGVVIKKGKKSLRR